MHSNQIASVLFVILLVVFVADNYAEADTFSAKRTVIPLEVSVAEDSAGGIIAANLDGGDDYELIVTAPGYVGAYKAQGRRLWSWRTDVRIGGQSESQGLPGHHGPGVQAGDIDGDGRTEVLFLDQKNTLHILRGSDGRPIDTVNLTPPVGAQRWEHVVIANFRGRGDRDILLQATNSKGYRMGRYLAAYSIESLRDDKRQPLWQRDDFLACAHNGARVADLDGDGRDEVLGAMIIGSDGRTRLKLDVVGHIDSVFVADVLPGQKGLEVVMLEEGRLNRVFLTAADRLIWQANYHHQEPQNAAIGRFMSDRTDMLIWCRSRYNTHQKPFVFDARGKLRSEYKMDDVAPEGWTDEGVEVIHTIHWTGENRMYACAKERHTAGDVCIFDPMTGRFLLRLDESADRLYVADLMGDWREEIVVWNDDELHIYTNDQPNRRPYVARLWTWPHYRRSKTTWNYYSP